MTTTRDNKRRFEKVAVLMGGVSSEREVSLHSGHAVLAGLLEAGYRAVPRVLDEASIQGLPRDVEAVFLALHGAYGEDGGVQADLDRVGIPYTGSGSAASRLAMDKVASKRLLEKAGIPTPAYELLPPERATTSMTLPLVVKPPRDGSSLGVKRVREPSEWEPSLAVARAIDPEVLVEQYIPGFEWTVGIVGAETLPVVEIRARDDWYDYDAKYVDHDTRYLFPEDFADRELVARCRRLAWNAFEVLGGRGLGRVDFRVTRDGAPYVLELNTIPGFTETSLVPKAAARAGLSFSALCGRIMECATCDSPETRS